MSKFSKDEARVALYIILYGLSSVPAKLTVTEKSKILYGAAGLIRDGHDVQDLLDAARFGMREVWPFSKGDVWNHYDFRKNVTKAKAAAAKLRRAGLLPKPARRIIDG